MISEEEVSVSSQEVCCIFPSVPTPLFPVVNAPAAWGRGKCHFSFYAFIYHSVSSLSKINKQQSYQILSACIEGALDEQLIKTGIFISGVPSGGCRSGNRRFQLHIFTFKHNPERSCLARNVISHTNLAHNGSLCLMYGPLEQTAHYVTCMLVCLENTWGANPSNWGENVDALTTTKASLALRRIFFLYLKPQV